MPVGSIGWFALHEGRMAWRDWRMLMGSQSRRRIGGVIVVLLLLTVFLHLLAGLVIHPAADLAIAPGKRALVTISGMLLLSWSLMLSQAMEAVTRAFYVRGDLELILSSPVAAWRLFAVRIVAMAVTIMLMSLVLTAPFINVMAWRGGARWLAAYPAAMSLAMLAVALAIVMTVALFQAIGPKRTRLIAQIVAAFIGAIFAISLQFAAILSLGKPDRLAFLESDAMTALAPEPDSVLWGVAYAAMGRPVPLVVLLTAGVVGLGAAIVVFVPRFGRVALAAASIARGPARGGEGAVRFRNVSPAQSLRRKEWTLLLRDPWLVSQTLVQILYLLPAAYLLWRTFSTGIDAVSLLVPVLITASGQFSGGLAWLAISGEDAPELIRTAPVSPTVVLRAKIEAVLGGTLMVFSPFLLALLATAPSAGAIAAAGILAAGAAAAAIQYWYRLQAHRGRIRRRQTASRFTTYAEALSSVSWATTAALAVEGLWLALIPGFIGCLVVATAWFLSPARGAARG